MVDISTALLFGLFSFVGGCFGVGCYNFLCSRSASSGKGPKFLLIGLQVLALTLSLASSALSPERLEPVCKWLADTFPGAIGPCDCLSDIRYADKECVYRQSSYRIESSVLLVFLADLLFFASGHNVTRWPILKFIALIGLVFLLMFVPDGVFGLVGELTSVLAPSFQIVQAIGWAAYWCHLNSRWNREPGDSTDKERDRRSPRSARKQSGGLSVAKVALLLLSMVFLGLGIALCVHLCLAYSGGAWMAGPIASMAATFLMLGKTPWCGVSTDTVEASAFILFSQWMAWQGLAAGYPACLSELCGPPAWLSLLLFGSTMVILATLDVEDPEQEPRLARANGRSDDEESAALVNSSNEVPDDFSWDLVAHALGAAYIMSVLAPTRGLTPCLAIFLNLGLFLAVFRCILATLKVVVSKAAEAVVGGMLGAIFGPLARDEQR